jgi:hypothetical protein
VDGYHRAMAGPSSWLDSRVGAVYEDCAFHPVLCTHVSDMNDEIQGISLVDGSEPRACSLSHCHPEPLSHSQAIWIMRNFDEYVRGRKTRRAPAEVTGCI